jgi:hypothetical protein
MSFYHDGSNVYNRQKQGFRINKPSSSLRKVWGGGGKGKIKTSKRRKPIRTATSGNNDINTETQQRISAMEKKQRT